MSGPVSANEQFLRHPRSFSAGRAAFPDCGRGPGRLVRVKLGAAKAEAGRVYHLVEVQVPKPEQPVNAKTFTFSLRKDKLRQAFRSEGHYLLRSNLCGEDPAVLWRH